jgi:hypothetical protein
VNKLEGLIEEGERLYAAWQWYAAQMDDPMGDACGHMEAYANLVDWLADH